MNAEVRIVGREKESCLLEDIYQKSMINGQVVWIYGASGVGKSALIQEFCHKKKNVCTGKFDSLHSSVPYSAIIKLLDNMCCILESGSLTITTGPEMRSILVSLLPQINNVVTLNSKERGEGEQINTTRFESKDNKLDERGFERLKQAIRIFFKEAIDVISSHFRLPTTIILDDLQWADDASLEILKPILNIGGGEGLENYDWKGLLCIGAYRNDELDETNPFWKFKKMSKFERNGKNRIELPLKNLKLSDVINVLSDFLQLTPSQAESLGKHVYDATRGNSLFVCRYIQHIRERNFLSSSQDLDDRSIHEGITALRGKILSKDIDGSDGIIAFLADEINNLPHRSASQILKVASLLGYNVDIHLLEVIVEDLEIDTLRFPYLSILELLESNRFIILENGKESFHFVHDRIHQAAYYLCHQEGDFRQVSLRLGQIILNKFSYQFDCDHSKSRSRFLQAVNQMNRGRALIDTKEDQENLARLNLQAAKVVLRLSAFNVAQNHLETSLELLGVNCWEIHYDLTLTISNLLASVLTGNGLMDQSLKLIDQISERSNCVDDRCDAQILKLEVLACINQLDQCFELSQKILVQLKLPKVPLNPGLITIIPAMLAVKKMLKPFTSEDILILPLCENSRIQRAVKICKLENEVIFASCTCSNVNDLVWNPPCHKFPFYVLWLFWLLKNL
jgi:predicted ATPase